jgi:hypothetical protein
MERKWRMPVLLKQLLRRYVLQLTAGAGARIWRGAGQGLFIEASHRTRKIKRPEVGDVITLELGVYTEALQGGIRLEDNYVVREHHLENLFDLPKELCG